MSEVEGYCEWPRATKGGGEKNPSRVSGAVAESFFFRETEHGVCRVEC